MSNPFRQSQSKSKSKPHQSRHSNKHPTRHSASKHSTPRSGDAYYDPGPVQDPAYGYDQTGEYYDEQYDQAGYADPQADYRQSHHLSAPVANSHDRRHRHRHKHEHDVYCDPKNQLPQNADY